MENKKRLKLKEQARKSIKNTTFTTTLMAVRIYVSSFIAFFLPYMSGEFVYILTENEKYYYTITIFSFLILIFVLIFFQYSWKCIFFNISRKTEINISDVNLGFQNINKYFPFKFLIISKTVLWSLLAIVPGVRKYIRYSMAQYVMLDNPAFSPREALKESEMITQGRELEILKLFFSFSWWYLLCFVTLGVALIYVNPYVHTTFAYYYNTIRVFSPFEDVEKMGYVEVKDKEE